MGTNMVLDKRIFGEQAELASIQVVPLDIAHFIVVLENYNGTEHTY